VTARSNGFAALAAVLLVLVGGIAVLYSIRALTPPSATATGLANPASPTPTATVVPVKSSPIETPPVKTNDAVTTVVRCGTLAANSVASGAGSGPNTYELHAPGGVSVARFFWPTGQSSLGTYICARLIAGAPMSGFDSLLRPGEPGYIAQPSAAASPGPSPDPSSVPDHVTIDARSYRIAPASAGGGTSLVRDFMPVSPPGGRPLMGSIEVVAEDGGVFPQDITVDRIWLYGPTVWDTAPAEVRRAPEAGTPPDQIEVIARDGPKWEPGIEVDLVLRLRFGAATYFLRLTSVAIERGS
jgi:hypothetical protein